MNESKFNFHEALVNLLTEQHGRILRNEESISETIVELERCMAHSLVIYLDPQHAEGILEEHRVKIRDFYFRYLKLEEAKNHPEWRKQ